MSSHLCKEIAFDWRIDDPVLVGMIVVDEGAEVPDLSDGGRKLSSNRHQVLFKTEMSDELVNRPVLLGVSGVGDMKAIKRYRQLRMRSQRRSESTYLIIPNPHLSMYGSARTQVAPVNSL